MKCTKLCHATYSNYREKFSKFWQEITSLHRYKRNESESDEESDDEESEYEESDDEESEYEESESDDEDIFCLTFF